MMADTRDSRAQQFLTDILRPGYAEIEDVIDIPRSDAADIVLVAIAGQEADWRHRYQVLNSGNKGPARGLWQFERGGGVHGVLRHKRTATKARDLCAARGITPEDREHLSRHVAAFQRWAGESEKEYQWRLFKEKINLRALNWILAALGEIPGWAALEVHRGNKDPFLFSSQIWGDLC